MKITDKLFKETYARLGPDEMRGVMNLLDLGHTGIAERHTVEKLLAYVRKLEKQIGIDVPTIDGDVTGYRVLRIRERGCTYYAKPCI